MNLHLKIWRQEGPDQPGKIVDYDVNDVSTEMSFLEMLDVLNEELIDKGERPIEFEHDCREGICGSCSMVVNGIAHGPQHQTAVCQLHMRHFNDGDTIYIEPWRSRAFPIIKDLVTDRSAFDRIQKPADIYRLIPERRLMQTPYLSVRTSLTKLSTSLPVSVAAHVLPHVLTLRLPCLPELKLLTWRSCRKASLRKETGHWRWLSKWSRRFRRLLKPCRM